MQENGTQSNINQTSSQNDDVVTIDLGEIFGLLMHWLWLILLVGAACATVTYCICRFAIPEQYESTTSVYILDKSDSNGSSSTTYSDLQVGTQLTSDFAEIIKSRAVLEAVIDELSLDMSYTELEDKISVTTPEDTRIVSITVTDHDPELAQKIADGVREEATKQITSVMDIDAVNVVDEANYPTEKSAPHNTRDAVIAAILGMLAISIVLIVRYMMDDTIKSSEDVEKYLELPTLALIPMDEEILNNSVEHLAKQGKNKKRKKQQTTHSDQPLRIAQRSNSTEVSKRKKQSKKVASEDEDQGLDIFDIDVRSESDEEGEE